MNTATKTPIVLIHGLWMTPASWNTWAERYRAEGHEVIVPGWPGIDDRSVEDIRRDPSALKGIGLTQIVDHYEHIIRALPVKPIIMGHSFGGVITQMLADRGVGAAYVGVAPGQTAGITTLPCRRCGRAPRSSRTPSAATAPSRCRSATSTSRSATTSAAPRPTASGRSSR
ncbi:MULTISPECIES: triacylglycerol lipase [unclassified Microbacterium]|uniref:esterase/lipase family protein n=1 Tax=unclassified Microbacterium TaxID=2609290 RepID=UPI001FCE6C4E|nr:MULTISPECIES: alpha/beta hydrolase [unclassified Microbacterium]